MNIKKIIGSLMMLAGGAAMFGFFVVGIEPLIAGAIILGLGSGVRKSGKFDSIPKLVRKKMYINDEDLAILINVDKNSEFTKALKNRALRADLLITRNKCVVDNKVARDIVKGINREIEQYGMATASKVSNETDLPMEVIGEIIESTSSLAVYKKYSSNGDTLIATEDYINNINVMLATRIYQVVQRNRVIGKDDLIKGVLPSSIEKFLLEASLEYLKINGLINIDLKESKEGEKKSKEQVYRANLLEEGNSMSEVLDIIRNRSVVYGDAQA